MQAALPLLMVALTACEKTPDNPAADTGDTSTDLLREFPEPPDGSLEWVTPEYVVPAYSEQQWCVFGTYEGETVGIISQQTYQSENGHHVVLTSTTANQDDYPDGTVLDCTDPESLPMTDLEPLIVGGDLGNADNNYEGNFTLPSGLAARLKEGTRYVLQSHYVNVTADAIRVQDAIYTQVVPEAQVETWTAPFVHVLTEHPLPANQSTALSFTCDWDQDVHLLFVGGHMHEWGTSFATDFNSEAGTERIYEVEEWDPDYRDKPPYLQFELGEFAVTAGDSFTTHCEWFNDTDTELEFPEEMCVTFGMVYPSKLPLVCSPD